jgi:hypothetical protein
MATVRRELNPDEGVPYSTNFPARVQNNGTNFPVSGLAYDAATDEAACWKFIASDYGSGNLTLNIFWYADTASANNVVWEAQIGALSPGDNQDIETDGLAAVSYVQDTHDGTTGQRLHMATITISNLDSIASGDLVHLRIARDADSSNDTDDMTGDAILVMAELTYSDT